MQITSLDSTIIVTDDFVKDFKVIQSKYSKSKIFILVDENTRRDCLPILLENSELTIAGIIEIKSGENHKSVDSVYYVWAYLCNFGADRNSLVINLGGGVICDLGGFAASTFKRGIDFINIPTTLLAQVDASVGGKVGVNFEGLKNEIGLFSSPRYVLIDSIFLRTLDRDNLLSGFAEMIKHTLISSTSSWDKIKKIDILQELDLIEFKKQIAKSIFVKNDFVKPDPQDKNIRKGLNFGHTFGHAFESFFIEKGTPTSHGFAVANGIICELYISLKKLGFPNLVLTQIVDYIKNIYPKYIFEITDFEKIYHFMQHDKKNENEQINFTLLKSIGDVQINTMCTQEIIVEALMYYQSL